MNTLLVSEMSKSATGDASGRRPVAVSAPLVPLRLLYFERGSALLREHPILRSMVVAAALLAATGLLWSPANLSRYCHQVLPLIVGIALVPLAIRYCFAKLVDWRPSMNRFLKGSDDDFARWHQAELKWVTDYGRASVLGLILMVVALLSLDGLCLGLRAGDRAILGSLTAVGAFSCGVALYHVGIFGRLIWELGRFVVVIDAPLPGVRSVGALMTWCWVLAALLWGLFTSSALLPGVVLLKPLRLLSAPTALALVASFVICQIPLHAAMVKAKQVEADRLHSRLAELLERGIETLTSEEMQRVRLLEERMLLVAKKPEWPFDWRAPVGLATLPGWPMLMHLAASLTDQPNLKAAWTALAGG